MRGRSMTSTLASKISFVLGSLIASSLGGCAVRLHAGLPVAQLAAEHAQDDPAVTWRGHTRFYVVRGATISAIRGSLDRSTVWVDPKGGAFDAGTTWWYSWRWANDRDEIACRATSPTLEVKLEMVLPMWRQARRADPATIDAWERYAASLWQHELGHVDRAVATAADLMQTLREATPAPDCAALGRQIDSALRGQLAALELEQDSYDAATDHGATQGAIFPPERVWLKR
jgi:predicted secreted Zn-dependent protease